MIFAAIITAVVAYFIGNISTALIISKVVFKEDIRQVGSGSAGATNVFRTYGPKWGLVTFAMDVLKGFASYWIGYLIGYLVSGGEYSLEIAAVAGVFVVIGHDWPVMFGFHGGKGISATFGVMLAANPRIALVGALVALTAVILTNYMSIGSIVGLAVAFIFTLFNSPFPIKIMMLCLVILDVFQHRLNIKRLLQGTENTTMKKSVLDMIKDKIKDWQNK